jgi:hypothetical protein
VINEASRRATDFYGDSKYGKALHSLLKGKWDSKKVEKFLDKLGGGNDVKYARLIDFISGDVGLNIRKYKTVGEQLPELMKVLETLYTDFLTEAVNERTTKTIKAGTYKGSKEIETLLRSGKWKLIGRNGNEYELMMIENGFKTIVRNKLESVVDDNGMQRAGVALPQTEEEPIEEFTNESKQWFNDRKKWDKERNKLNVSDDNATTSKDSKGKVIALWNSDRNEGWIMKESTAEPKIITQLRDVMKSGYKKLKDPKSGRTMTVDSYSASAIVKVYDALNQQNREKFANTGLLGMQSMAFKLIK